MTNYTHFRDIPWGKYELIVCDPPWKFANYSKKGEAKNPVAQYSCMTLPEIKAMNFGMLAAKDCCLWLWGVNSMLPQAFDVLSAWGFRYVTAGHWAKTTVNGKQAFGTGYCLRGAGEPFLIGAIGRPKYARNIRSVLIAQARENSRKPDEAYSMAEALVPSATARLDAFSRQARPGWDAFGDEIGKFDEVTP